METRVGKFACVGYRTKSGQIWRPTPEKPNYLWDREREVDHTGYGCWSSALNGEHIPLHWFQFGRLAWVEQHWKVRVGKLLTGDYDRALLGLAASEKDRIRLAKFLQKLLSGLYYRNLAYVLRFDVVLTVIQDCSIFRMSEFVTRVKALSPDRPILIGSFDICFNDLREAIKRPDRYASFKRFCDGCDILVSIFRSAVDYLHLITDTPVVYFPMFFPWDYARSFFTDVDQKEKVIFASGNTHRSDNVHSLLVAKKIQERWPEFKIRVIEYPDTNLEPLMGADYEVVQSRSWPEFLQWTGRAYLVINMDNVFTTGRIPADAAVAGTPCIGVNADRQVELFPDLSCADMTGADTAVGLASRLIVDRDFYVQVQRKAFRRLEACSYSNSVGRLEILVELYRKGELGSWKDLEWDE